MTQAAKHVGKWGAQLALVATVVAPWALATTEVRAIQSVDELIVVDATGKKVGKAIDTGNEDTHVVLQLDEKTFIKLFVLPESVRSGNDVAFESADCSGPPYLISPGGVVPSLFAAAGVAPPGHTLYMEETGASARTISVGSVQDPSSGCEPWGSLETQAVPALKTVDLDTLFTPPFGFAQEVR